MSSVFEIGARILRRHWAVLLSISFVFGLPGALLSAASSVPFGTTLADILPQGEATAPIVISDAQAQDLATGLLIATAGSLIAGVLAVICAIGFARVVQQDYHSGRVTLRDAATQTLRRALPALGTAFLAAFATLGLLALGTVGVVAMLTALAPDGPSGGGIGVFLAILVGVACFFAVVVVSVRWALAASIVAIEPVGPMAALRRSWHLTRDATWRTFLALLLVNLVVGILGTIVSQVLAIVIVDLLADPAGVAVVGETLVSMLVTVLFAPVSTVVMTVFLYDQMVRRDGWDLPAPGTLPDPWGPGAPSA